MVKSSSTKAKAHKVERSAVTQAVQPRRIPPRMEWPVLPNWKGHAGMENWQIANYESQLMAGMNEESMYYDHVRMYQNELQKLKNVGLSLLDKPEARIAMIEDKRTFGVVLAQNFAKPVRQVADDTIRDMNNIINLHTLQEYEDELRNFRDANQHKVLYGSPYWIGLLGELIVCKLLTKLGYNFESSNLNLNTRTYIESYKPYDIKSGDTWIDVKVTNNEGEIRISDNQIKKMLRGEEFYLFILYMEFDKKTRKRYFVLKVYIVKNHNK